jgi:hypothetical protein
MAWSRPRDYERHRKSPESADQALATLLLALGTPAEHECYRAYLAWVSGDPIDESLTLIPAIQARRAIGILDPDEALHLIGSLMEVIMESRRETDPRLRALEDSIDALEARLGREHEAAHGCTLDEHGSCYDDDGYFDSSEALEDSPEYHAIVRQLEAESLRLEVQLLREHGEEEIARLRETQDPLFDERFQRGAKSLYPSTVW